VFTAAGDLPVMLERPFSSASLKPELHKSTQRVRRERERKIGIKKRSLAPTNIHTYTHTHTHPPIAQSAFYGIIKNQNLAHLSFEYFMTRGHF